MLPAPDDFDGFIASTYGTIARLELVKVLDEKLNALQQRSARARALAMLELYEETRTYDAVMLATGLSRPRVAQLLADGRLWRKHDAAERQA